MSQITNSASSSVTAVLNSVGSVANTFGSTFDIANDFAQMGRVKSAKMLAEVKLKAVTEATQSRALVIEEAARNVTVRMGETAKWLEANPGLKDTYTDLVKQMTEAATAAGV